MTAADIHSIILPAIRAAIEAGATARDLAEYFGEAREGMKLNAAFALKGADLLAALECES